MGISALIITRDEQDNIVDCLESLDWADEIVVVDSFSQDATVAICTRYTDAIYQRSWSGYADQKNYGHAKCSNKWILSIDADERVSSELQVEIVRTIHENSSLAAYRVPIEDYMFGKWIRYGGWNRQFPIRLYQKDKATWEKDVHETLRVDGDIGLLRGTIRHYSHTTITRFVSKMNHYTTLEASNLYVNSAKIGWLKILYTIPWHFLQRYVLWQGFRDGAHGLILAVLMGMYHFLTRVKLWELNYKEKRGLNPDGERPAKPQ